MPIAPESLSGRTNGTIYGLSAQEQIGFVMPVTEQEPKDTGLSIFGKG